MILAIERRTAIADRLQREGRVVVVSIAEELGITPETVRRDLDQLERSGIARRVHGGAVSAHRSSLAESPTSERDLHNAQAKAAIGRLAVSRLIARGATSLFIDAGTTCAAFATALRETWPLDPAGRLVVFTHAPSIAERLLSHPGIEVHAVGGRLRAVTGAAVGAQTVLAIGALRCDVAILGTNAIDSDGCSTPDPEEAAVKQAIVGSARRAAVLVDSSKLGESSLCRFADLAELDVVVTDQAPSPALSAAFAAAQCEEAIA